MMTDSGAPGGNDRSGESEARERTVAMKEGGDGSSARIWAEEETRRPSGPLDPGR